MTAGNRRTIASAGRHQRRIRTALGRPRTAEEYDDESGFASFRNIDPSAIARQPDNSSRTDRQRLLHRRPSCGLVRCRSKGADSSCGSRVWGDPHRNLDSGALSRRAHGCKPTGGRTRREGDPFSRTACRVRRTRAPAIDRPTPRAVPSSDRRWLRAMPAS